MFKQYKKNITITSIIFNAGFYNSFSIDNISSDDMRVDSLSINDVSYVNDFRRDNDSPNYVYLGNKVCCNKLSLQKKIILAAGVTALGLAGLGTGLYFLLRSKDEPKPPVPVTDDFTDIVSHIVKSTSVITSDEPKPPVPVTVPVTDNFTDIVSDIINSTSVVTSIVTPCRDKYEICNHQDILNAIESNIGEYCSDCKKRS